MEEIELVKPLAVAFVLSALIGLEREMRFKSAGLRTHTLVGVGSALFMIVSKHGFNDVINPGHIQLDPSRLASQIVTGIGFIGAGLIFLRHDVVRGLTSAAIVWVTAAVGTAAGAGLFGVAAATVVLHYVVAYGFPPIMRLLPQGSHVPTTMVISYRHREGTLRSVIAVLTDAGFAVEDLDVTRDEAGEVQVTVEITGKGALHETVTRLHAIAGVLGVRMQRPMEGP